MGLEFKSRCALFRAHASMILQTQLCSIIHKYQPGLEALWCPRELTQETNFQCRNFFLKRNIGCTVHIKEPNEISATHSNSLTPFHPFRTRMSANHYGSLQTLLPIP